MKLHIRLNFRQARLQGLWEELLARMDDCDGRVALTTWFASDAAQALIGRMPESWREMAEEELEKRCG